MRGDFSPAIASLKKKRPRVRLRFLLGLLLSLGFFYLSRQVLPVTNPSVSPGDPVQSTLAALDIIPPEAAEAPVRIENHTVRQGDTLYGIFRDFDLPDDQILEISRARVEGVDPSRLVAGRDYQLLLQEDRIVEYRYEPDQERMVRVVFEEEGPPSILVEPIPYHIRSATLSGTIEDSLFGAVDAIGENPALALNLADIFAWQVDFFRDLRKGDSFVLVVDKYYREDAFVRYGPIHAARFVNGDRSYLAFRYRMANGNLDYFDETGASLRKQFLKVPLRFNRISSGYTSRRLHPVTKKVTPHYGIDYAAPTGTPIMAIGDGKVIVKKYDAVNGYWLKLRHNSVYSSAYCHLNGFAKGIKVGSTVRQGQVIAYVGKSGRATGPHLHFAMYKNGQYVNPKTVKVPQATSVPSDEKEAFMAKVETFSTLLSPDAPVREALRQDR